VNIGYISLYRHFARMECILSCIRFMRAICIYTSKYHANNGGLITNGLSSRKNATGLLTILQRSLTRTVVLCLEKSEIVMIIK
jgi:hypothetical protein